MGEGTSCALIYGFTEKQWSEKQLKFESCDSHIFSNSDPSTV